MGTPFQPTRGTTRRSSSRSIRRRSAAWFVGALVTGGCLAVTAGVGSVGCFVAGGAAAGAVTNVWKQAQSGKSFDVGSFVFDTAVGGAMGLFGPVSGAATRVIAPAALQAAGALTTAMRPAVSAVTSQVKNVAGAALRPWAQSASRITQGLSSRSQSAASCVVNSFVPGTLVLLANGVKAPIESLTVGDEMLATDPETGETGPEPVVATITGAGEKDLVTITVSSDGVTGSVVATAVLQILVLNPLAAAPGQSVEEIWGDPRSEAFLVPAVLSIGPLLAIAFAIYSLARLRGRPWLVTGPGMYLADAHGLDGADYSPWAEPLHHTSTYAVIALAFLGLGAVTRSVRATMAHQSQN